MTGEVRQAVIMVGGMGTRLRPLTDTRPKPILPILDKPCLSYLIDSLVDAGITEIYLACGYRSQQLEEAIGDGTAQGIRILYSYEDEPRGTGGAIKMLVDRLDDVFIAANGDTFVDMDVKEEIALHSMYDAKVTIALTEVDNPCEYGIARVDEEMRISEFKEKPKLEEVFSNLVNAGVYILNKEIMDLVPADTFYDLSKDLFPILMERGDRIQGYKLKGVWRDVGRPKDLIGTNLVMATRKDKDFFWGNKQLVDTEVNKPFYMGKDSIAKTSKISASVVSADCTVSGSQITGSLLMKGCKVENSKIENSILGENCVVGSNTKIINSVLGDGTIVEEGESILDTPGRSK